MGINWKRINSLGRRTEPEITSSTIIELDNTMSVQDMQARIDHAPRFLPYGVFLEIHFADGTYSMNSTLNFSNFFGSGTLYIHGNTSESNSLHSNQAVILDWSGSGTTIPFYFNDIKCPLDFRYIHAKQTNTSLSSERRIIYANVCDAIYIRYCFFEGTTNGLSGQPLYSLRLAQSKVYVDSCYLDKSYISVLGTDQSVTHCRNNGSTVASTNTYCYQCTGASFLGYTGTTPTYGTGVTPSSTNGSQYASQAS